MNNPRLCLPFLAIPRKTTTANIGILYRYINDDQQYHDEVELHDVSFQKISLEQPKQQRCPVIKSRRIHKLSAAIADKRVSRHGYR